MNRILLIDLSQRELQERARLRARRDQLEAIDRTASSSGGLTGEQTIELQGIRVALDSDAPVDPFYQSVASTVAHRPWKDLRNDPQYLLKHGLFHSQQALPDPDPQLTNDEKEIAFVCGILQLDNWTSPKAPGFIKRIAEARGEFHENEPLFDAAYRTFAAEFDVTVQDQIDANWVDPDIVGCIAPDKAINQDAKIRNKAFRRDAGGALRAPKKNENWVPVADDHVNAVSARSIAAVVRKLVSDGVEADDPWISSRLRSAFNTQTGVVAGAPPSAIEISLPDLEEAVDIEIQAENLKAVQAIYFGYQLEEMRLFQVVERIVELFRQGLLPLGRNSVGDKLFNYYKKAAEHITEGERRDLYQRCFGAPGGTPSSEPNRDFNELWLRFVSSVSNFSRQLTVEKLLRDRMANSVSQETVRKAARDLGANLSRCGYGMAWYAATDLQASITEFRDILTDAELRACFGARDMWQVIDQVNVNYLGGARNTHRYRTQSRAGAVIIGWIGKRVQRLSNVGGMVIDPAQITNLTLRAASGTNNPTVDPTDWDLVNACEQWLAVGGVQDQSIDNYSQPIEAPTMTSRPIDMPQMARDALSSFGLTGVNGAAGGISLPGM